MSEKDSAFIADAKVIAGVDDLKNQHALNCTEDGTLEVALTGTAVPLDVIVDNVIPVSQSGTWTINLATEPTIDIGKVDQGTAGTLANGWPVKITDGLNVLGTVTNPVNVAGSFAPPALQNVNLTQVNGTPVNLGQQLMSASIPVVLASNESALPVTGTFFQTTQPVSGTVGVSNFPATQPISGSITVLNASIPVTQSGSWTVGVNNFPASQVVTLSSTTITGTVAVTQSTSPWVVSGTVTTTPPANASTNLTEVAGILLGSTAITNYGTAPAAVAVPGVNAFITNTPAVTLASTTVTGNVTVVQPTGSNLNVAVSNFPATQPVSGTVAVTQSTSPWVTSLASTTITGNVTAVQPTGTNLHVVVDSAPTTAVTGTFFQATQPVSGSGNFTVVQPTAANLNALVTQQTLTKNTQGSTGVSTQDLKDSGRTYVTFTANAIAGVTSEALFSFTQNKQGTTTGAVTSYTVTNGKTLRLIGLYLSNQDGTTTISWGRALLRHNPAGATTITSPLIAVVQCGGSGALAGATGFASVPFAEGIEIYGNGTQSIGVSHLDQATTNVACCTLVGYEY